MLTGKDRLIMPLAVLVDLLKTEEEREIGRKACFYDKFMFSFTNDTCPTCKTPTYYGKAQSSHCQKKSPVICDTCDARRCDGSCKQ